MQTAVCRCANVTLLPALQSWAKVMGLLVSCWHARSIDTSPQKGSGGSSALRPDGAIDVAGNMYSFQQNMSCQLLGQLQAYESFLVGHGHPNVREGIGLTLRNGVRLSNSVPALSEAVLGLISDPYVVQ